MHILLSRTDSIGDVMLTLPMAGVIKRQFPEAKITFLGSSYTAPVVACCSHIDAFLDWNAIQHPHPENTFKSLEIDYFIHVFPRIEIAKLAKKAGIKNRIGTSGRLYHYYTCNHLVRFSRKRSALHEAQLNLKLLAPFQKIEALGLEELSGLAGFNKIPKLESTKAEMLDPEKINVILHPKSKGSAVEWGLENFKKLIHLLPPEKYHIYVSGTPEDALSIGDSLPLDAPHVTSLLGKLSLTEFISFIGLADCLVAASTGPLHIAGLMNKVAIGLYSSRKPIHPGRWRPLGKNAHALTFDDQCPDCAQGKSCHCIANIPAERIIPLLTKPSDLSTHKTEGH